MSALASPLPATPGPLPTAPGRPAALARDLRWLLRLHRPTLYVWAAVVVVLAAALLWLAGPLTDASADAWRDYDACRDGGRCSYYQDAILRYKDVYSYTTLALTALPFLVAAWSGAALIGRELESGTAHLAWTQGVSPARWLAVKLAAPAVLVAAGTGLLVRLHHRAWSAANGRVDTAKSWYDGLTLHTNGPTTVGLALAGLAVGALAGLLWRRALPALVTGLVATAAVRVLADRLMPHLWAADTVVTPLSRGPGGVGITVDEGIVTSTGAHAPLPHCPPEDAVHGCTATYAKADAVGFFHSYHPAAHYWPLQLTTTAVLLALVAVLTVIAFRLLGRSTDGAARDRRTTRAGKGRQDRRTGAAQGRRTGVAG
ncbi:ABC transporter permease [Streptomyces longwoodensis]|uniref:ABC transporter permease n=1 Tax=Streptomyces longwoodensis TaxID=68231 RepID=UPI0033D0C3E2